MPHPGGGPRRFRARGGGVSGGRGRRYTRLVRLMAGAVLCGLALAAAGAAAAAGAHTSRLTAAELKWFQPVGREYNFLAAALNVVQQAETAVVSSNAAQDSKAN